MNGVAYPRHSATQQVMESGDVSAVMEIIFGDMHLVNLVLYTDDIMLYAKSVNALIATIEKVLERLIVNGFKAAGKKCQCLQESVTFLGHVVSSKGVAVNPDKIEKIVYRPIHRTTKELRSFLGLASFFRRFAVTFPEHAKPLYNLIQGEQPKSKTIAKITWNEEADVAFRAIKRIHMTVPMLAFPWFDRRFLLVVDASLRALGAWLPPEGDGGLWHSIIRQQSSQEAGTEITRLFQLPAGSSGSEMGCYRETERLPNRVQNHSVH